MANLAQPTCADMLAQTLAKNGCKRVFGIPGGEVLAILDALYRVGIEFVLVKHENSGGFLAEGAWHADGCPPVLLATIGPGVANAVNVVANAHQDKVPLIFISGCVDHVEAQSYTHQVFDHQAVLRPIVKETFLGTTDTCGEITQKALQIALDPQQGPVHLDIPVSVAEASATKDFIPQEIITPVISPVEDEAFTAMAKQLETAKNPIAIAGVDAVNEAAGPAIQAFCEKHNIPLITTYKGKGLIDERNPLAICGAGLSPKADTVLMPLLENADTILLLGYDPIEMRIGWCNPWDEAKPVYEITPITRTHGMHHVSHTLEAHIIPTLDALDKQMTPSRDTINAKALEARQALANMFAAKTEFGPDRVFHTLRDVMPEDTIATADSGAHRILLSHIWKCYSPRTLLQSSALCTMGCAVPIAAGYKHASPQAPVIAFVGDAGLEMTLGELATLREYNIPIIICVLVDESLTLIEMKQRASQRPNVGVDFSGSDFPAIAEALGGHGVWIDDAQTLEREATAALNRDNFTVLACRIGRKAYDGWF